MTDIQAEPIEAGACRVTVEDSGSKPDHEVTVAAAQAAQFPEVTSEELIEAAFRTEGLHPHTWSNEPGFEYEEHEHEYHKVLYCTAGSITFHTPSGDVALKPGERLPPGTPHGAIVEPAGVTCMEAPRR